MKHCSPFGPMLREERIKRNIKLWKFAASVPFPTSNIQRIEAGITDPRIGTAIKMLSALNVEVGGFMQTLAETQGWERYPIPAGFSVEILAREAEKIRSEHGADAISVKTIFGEYFRHTRLACGLTQTQIAARASYTTRSLITIEGGKQEPGVMRALQLVWVSGMQIVDFFSILQG